MLYVTFVLVNSLFRFDAMKPAVQRPVFFVFLNFYIRREILPVVSYSWGKALSIPSLLIHKTV